MKVFTAGDDVCAKNLLTIVAHGNAIIAEILRLKDYIPPVFLFNTRDIQAKYNENVMDFSYFKILDQQEKKIASDLKLTDIDEEIKETYLELITRFYLAFESIYQYIIELNLFLLQLQCNFFIQHTLETVLHDVEGKQLLCESLYLYGSMLLVCDLFIPGPVRERLMVAFYRYSTNQSQSHIDDVCKLLADTGFHGGKKPTDYPVQYFQRVKVDPKFIEGVINSLRSEDVYNQLTKYPLAEHRSVALATQASMLFVSLFFSPECINNENTLMREIVDKFFSDNWMIQLYMGININLFEMWDDFKAAKNAISTTGTQKNIKSISTKYKSIVQSLSENVQKFLKEGYLTEEIILEDISRILTILRQANCVLRWLLMHTTSSNFYENTRKYKQLRDNVIKCSNIDHDIFLDLLVNTAQLEFKTRILLQNLIKGRNENWTKNLKQATSELESLAELFSGEKQLNKIKANLKLKSWFETIANQLILINEDMSNNATKRISQLLNALDEVEEYHGLKDSAVVVQGLSETKGYLKNALKTAALKVDYLVTLEIISDFSYAWLIIDNYTVFMQSSIIKNPSVAGKLRTLFLKLASAMDIPLLRLNQSESEDLESVSEYFSSELVNYIKRVLQIIPETVFNILAKIIELQTSHINEVPTRLDKDKLKEFAQLQQRLEIAKLTHSASTFMKGILQMKTTLVGVLKIDPAYLLEDGLKKELSRHIYMKFENVIEMKSKKGNNNNLNSTLQTLAANMDGFKRSLEYIQDYINCHGLMLWNEEFSKIISRNTSCEMNRHGLIEVYSPSVSFLGSLSRDIVQTVDVRICYYSMRNWAWIDLKSSKVIVDLKTFLNLKQALDPVGMHGLDTIYACMIKQLLQTALLTIKNVTKDNKYHLSPSENNDINNDVTLVITKNTKTLTQLSDIVVLIGTLQTLRKFLAFQLNTNCKFENTHLESSLRTLNKAILTNVKNDLRKSHQTRISSEMIKNIEEYFLRAGLYDPYQKVYVKDNKESAGIDVSFLATSLLLSQIGRLQINSAGDIVVKRSGDNIDEHCLLVGLYTFLIQFGLSKTEKFAEYLCQYVNSIRTSSESKTCQPEEAIILKLIEDFCYTFKLPISFIMNKIPLGIFH